MVTKIYTKTGDQGDTGLYGGQRVPKDNVRVEAYGDVDELNAMLGVAIATGEGSPALRHILGELQILLFELGAELATPPSRRKQAASITEQDIHELEKTIDAAEGHLKPLQTFVMPGGTRLASALHVARCVCRRAERQCVTLRHSEPETPLLAVTFLNRLSDLLFVLARLANNEAHVDDIPWTPRGRIESRKVIA